MSGQKNAAVFTQRANKGLYDDPNLDWGDKLDFEFAQRGFIAKFDDPVITNAFVM